MNDTTNSNDQSVDEILSALMSKVSVEELRGLLSVPKASNASLVNIDRQKLYRKRLQFKAHIKRAIAILDTLVEEGVVVSPLTKMHFEACIRQLSSYDMSKLPLTERIRTERTR